MENGVKYFEVKILSFSKNKELRVVNILRSEYRLFHLAFNNFSFLVSSFLFPKIFRIVIGGCFPLNIKVGKCF